MLSSHPPVRYTLGGTVVKVFILQGRMLWNMYDDYFGSSRTKHSLISTEITGPHSFYPTLCSPLVPWHHKPLISIWFQHPFRSPLAPSCLSFYFLPSFMLPTVGLKYKVFPSWKENYSRTQRTHPAELVSQLTVMQCSTSFHFMGQSV